VRFTDLIAEGRCSSVLPHYGVIDRLAGFAFPDDRRFALIGYANGGNIRSFKTGFSNCFNCRVGLALPYFDRVMFNPTGLREDLWEFLLSDRNDGSVVAEHDRAAAARSLIKCENIGHIITYALSHMSYDLAN